MQPITINEKDLEKYTGISGLDTAVFLAKVISISLVVQRGFAVFGVGAASVAGGEMAIAGAGTLIPGGSQVAVSGSGFGSAIGAKLMFATGLLAVAASVVNIGLAMGLPVAQAKQMVRERQYLNGFAYGCTIRLLGYGKPMLANFRDRTNGSGFGPSYMVGVAQQAFNTGLIIGFAAALNFTDERCTAYRDAMTQALIERSKRQGAKLYMQNWSANMWVQNYVQVFPKLL